MEAVDTERSDRLKRAADQIQSQHRRLEPLFEGLSRALAGRSSREAQTAAFRLSGAFKAHLLLEEEVVFPAIRGLCLEQHSDLEVLVEDHQGLGVGLQSVIDQILKGQLELAAGSLESCRLAVKDHERREEAFLTALDSAPSECTL
jgi:iron-sulfur cluster repair protein YtfE (RIC family)